MRLSCVFIINLLTKLTYYDVVWQELRSDLDTHRPQKTQLSSAATELLASRPKDDELRERMESIDVDWDQLESSLDDCKRQLSEVQTLLLPSVQAAHELTIWMDGIERTVVAESGIRPKNSDDVKQLLEKFKVRYRCCGDS